MLKCSIFLPFSLEIKTESNTPITVSHWRVPLQGVSVVFFLWQNPYTCVRNMCVPKERMKDLHLATGGRGGVCAIRGVSNSELTNWDSKRKRMDGVSVNIVFNVLRLSKNIRMYK